MRSPWRTIIVGARPSDAAGYATLNLMNPINYPPLIEPGKYIGVCGNDRNKSINMGSGPHHGATTEKG